MKLTNLEPTFLKLEDVNSERIAFRFKPETRESYTIAEADGVMFLCPVCFEKNGGPRKTHTIRCWQPHVPQTVYPTPGRWNFLGTGLDDLTLQNGSSSILLEGDGCGAHFWIRNGAIEFC